MLVAVLAFLAAAVDPATRCLYCLKPTCQCNACPHTIQCNECCGNYSAAVTSSLGRVRQTGQSNCSPALVSGKFSTPSCSG